jgi:hypothetical protein
MEYYSAIKKNETMLFVGKWIELENIMLNEISRFRKTNIVWFISHVESSLKK